MNLWRALLHSLGPLGIAGAGLLLCCAAFYLGAVKPAETEVVAQREAAQRLKSRSPRVVVTAEHRRENLRRFFGLFPSTESIPAELEKLWGGATKHQIALQQSEFRLESDNSGLSRYRVTLPVKASYVQLRQFINFILQETPTISIDDLRFERKKVEESQLDAQIRLTLYLRPGI